jgi:hypothetical protein
MNTTVSPDFSALPKQAVSSEKPKAMLSVEESASQTLVRINSSSLGIILTCPRKAKYSLYDGWKSRTVSAPLVYGSAMHKGLEIFYSHPSRERVFPRNFEEQAALMAYGHSAPEKHFLYDAIEAFVTAAAPLQGLPDTDSRSIASGVWTLTHYFKTYLLDSYVIHCDETGPITERTFSIPFYEEPRLSIELFGTIDFVLRNEITGEILVGDHKTSSRMGNEFLSRIKPNHQYTGYLIGAHRTLGTSSEHFLVNGIQVKSRPLTSRGGPPTFTRQITRRSQQDFDEFRDTLVLAVRNYLHWLRTDHWTLGHVDACASYGGCSYLDVCAAPNALRSNILEAKFQKN